MIKKTFPSLFIFLFLALPHCGQCQEILVSAAASLTEALTEAGKAFQQANPRMTVRFNFGASGALQQQIMQGAPVDVFASASPKEMDALQRAGRIQTVTRINFAGNRLTLIARAGCRLRTWEDLKRPEVRRIALSNPASVPSGRYAEETLTRRGLWKAVQPKAILGENVRQTLAYVENGDVDAGIVFATDARIAGSRVRVVQEANPGRDHEPIVYPAAMVTGCPQPVVARRFLAFLQGPAALKILSRFGFTPVLRRSDTSRSAHP